MIIRVIIGGHTIIARSTSIIFALSSTIPHKLVLFKCVQVLIIVVDFKRENIDKYIIYIIYIIYIKDNKNVYNACNVCKI